MPRWSEADLDALIVDATVDAYNDDEQLVGFYTMIDDNLDVPFETEVLGVRVVAERVDLTVNGEIVVVCRRDSVRQVIGILELPLPTPEPEGGQWIGAYRRWAGR